MDPNKIGRIIMERRKYLKMTQKELAKKLYITDKAISKWERGLSLPDISTLIPLTEILNLNLYDLMKGETNMNKESIEQTLKNTIKYSEQEIKRSKKTYFKIGIAILLTFFVLFISYQFALKYEMPVKYQEGLTNVVIPVDKGIDIYTSLFNYKEFNHILVKTEEESYDLYVSISTTLMTKMFKDYRPEKHFLRVSGTYITDIKTSKNKLHGIKEEYIKRIYYVNKVLKEEKISPETLQNMPKTLIWERA